MGHCFDTTDPTGADWGPGASGGFIALLDDRGARIVADGLGYTNECMPSPDGRYLYANETQTRHLARFPIRADGSLGPKERLVAFGEAELPDGLAFNAEGQIWVTMIAANRLVRVDPESRKVACMLDGSDLDHVARVEAAWRDGTLAPSHMATAGKSPLGNVSSLAFAGPGRHEAWLGCLLLDRVMRTPMPVAGHPPPHWSWQ